MREDGKEKVRGVGRMRGKMDRERGMEVGSLLGEETEKREGWGDVKKKLMSRKGDYGKKKSEKRKEV